MDGYEDSRAFRDALGRYGTGVAVVGATDQSGKAIGMTINSFASVSLSPPLILWSVESAGNRAADYAAASVFGISILHADQEPMARRFADGTLPACERFDDVPRLPSETGAPLLDGAIAWFDCRREAVYPGGDHDIILGRVVMFGQRPGPGLLFQNGRFCSIDQP